MFACPTSTDVSAAVRQIFGGVLPEFLCPDEQDDRLPAKATPRDALDGVGRRGGHIRTVEIDRSCVSGEARIDGRTVESCSNFVSIRTQATTSVVQVALLAHN